MHPTYAGVWQALFQHLMYIILHIFVFKIPRRLLFEESIQLQSDTGTILSAPKLRDSPWTLLHTGAKEDDKYVLVHALIESRMPNPHTNYVSNHKTDNSISLFLYSQSACGCIVQMNRLIINACHIYMHDSSLMLTLKCRDTQVKICFFFKSSFHAFSQWPWESVIVTHSMFLWFLFAELTAGTNKLQGAYCITVCNIFYFLCFQRHCQYLRAKSQTVTAESYTNTSLNRVLIRLLFIQPLHCNNSPWGIPLNWLLMCVFKRATLSKSFMKSSALVCLRMR